MKNLKKFATVAEYNAFKDSLTDLDYPVTSYIVATHEIKFDNDYSNQYFTIEMLESGSINISLNYTSDTLYYSINGGEWQSSVGGSRTLTFAKGDKIRLKANVRRFNMDSAATAKHKVYGCIQSMFSGDNFKASLANPDFSATFLNDFGLIDAKNLFFQKNAYTGYVNFSCMFYNCKNLINAPDLSNVTTTSYTNLSDMFYQCTALKELKISKDFAHNSSLIPKGSVERIDIKGYVNLATEEKLDDYYYDDGLSIINGKPKFVITKDIPDEGFTLAKPGTLTNYPTRGNQEYVDRAWTETTSCLIANNFKNNNVLSYDGYEEDAFNEWYYDHEDNGGALFRYYLVDEITYNNKTMKLWCSPTLMGSSNWAADYGSPYFYLATETDFPLSMSQVATQNRNYIGQLCSEHYNDDDYFINYIDSNQLKQPIAVFLSADLETHYDFSPKRMIIVGYYD